MSSTGIPGQPPVGDRVIEAVHHLRLGQDGQPGQVSQLEPGGVDPGEPAGAEGVVLDGAGQQRSQPRALKAWRAAPGSSRGASMWPAASARRGRRPSGRPAGQCPCRWLVVLTPPPYPERCSIWAFRASNLLEFPELVRQPGEVLTALGLASWSERGTTPVSMASSTSASRGAGTVRPRPVPPVGGGRQ